MTSTANSAATAGGVRAPGRAPARRGPGRATLLRLALLAAGVTALWLFPWYAPNDSAVLTVSTILMWVIIGTSWNLISGFTGYVDFGHGVHFGVGGYVTGYLMTRHDWGFGATLPVAALGCAAFAALIGWPLLRLRGVYFSIAMLGAFLSMREFAFIWKPVTGGASGLVIDALVDRNWFFYMFLIGAVAVVALAVGLRRSQLGASLLAIRDDEAGAEARGINTTAVKLVVFSLAAAITGVVGSFWAYQTTFVDPNILFREDFLITVAVMATLGGLGTTWGPAVGAAVYLVLQDTFWANDSSGLFLVWFGLTLVLIVLFLPEGIAGTLQRGERSAAGRAVLRLRRRFGMRDHAAYDPVADPGSGDSDSDSDDREARR
ncbi:branched-chain amino acid ABC transporter permease [Pseudonocardia sp. HH130630-07]|uniref:branched-chain amino acid ABC transporter permease n=1 Tax=Pseudonocardia sp. HH130630-07 TaxID=1690815 RepID=UPI0008150A84|nr:branched-chain amino acid ABC transporter permease [Pseudonocardia sp. HH130630-07]ANY08510.1 hypothetical protein AFB00_22065 [Pseudonocardia sp. HH130630-07]